MSSSRFEEKGMHCQRCQGEDLVKAGFDRCRRQIYGCSSCGHRHTCRSRSAFSGYRFPDEIIALAVRWYLRFRLPYADVAELLAERGIHVDPSTVFDWVQRFAPLYEAAARPYRHRVGQRWSIDETYVRIAGQWCYAFRAIDENGQIIDVYVSPTRDTEAARVFLTRALDTTGITPDAVTTDKAPIYPAAWSAFAVAVDHRMGKMEQQDIERDHQHLKGRIRSMRGFQTVSCAQVVCAGHALIRNLDNGFYRLGLPLSDPRTPRAPRLVRAWDQLTAHLAAA